MSFMVLRWAGRQTTGSMAAKAVLMALADFANDNGEAWPSTAAIAERAEMNVKTVITMLARLERKGLIADTGKRVGRTAQVKRWVLGPGLEGANDDDDDTPPADPASTSGNGIAGEDGRKRKPSVSSLKATRKRVTEAVRESLSSGNKFPSESRGRAMKDDLPDWLPQSAWQSFTGMRREKGRPVTRCAVRLLVARLASLRQAGHEPAAVLLQSAMNSWTDLYPVDCAKTETAAVRNLDDTLPTSFDHPDEDPRCAALRNRIAEGLGAATYGAWIHPLRFSFTGATLTLKADSPVRADYIRNHLLARITPLVRPMLPVGTAVTVQG